MITTFFNVPIEKYNQLNHNEYTPNNINDLNCENDNADDIFKKSMSLSETETIRNQAISDKLASEKKKIDLYINQIINSLPTIITAHRKHKNSKYIKVANFIYDDSAIKLIFGIASKQSRFLITKLKSMGFTVVKKNDTNYNLSICIVDKEYVNNKR
jgi:hypothetical protein